MVCCNVILCDSLKYDFGVPCHLIYSITRRCRAQSCLAHLVTAVVYRIYFIRLRVSTPIPSPFSILPFITPLPLIHTYTLSSSLPLFPPLPLSLTRTHSLTSFSSHTPSHPLSHSLSLSHCLGPCNSRQGAPAFPRTLQGQNHHTQRRQSKLI